METFEQQWARAVLALMQFRSSLVNRDPFGPAIICTTGSRSGKEANESEERAWRAGYAGPPMVMVSTVECKALIAELDRLREFERDVMALREDPNAGSPLWIAKVIATMNGNYHGNGSATGGEGT